MRDLRQKLRDLRQKLSDQRQKLSDQRQKSDAFFSYLGCRNWHQRLRVWVVRKLLRSLAKEGIGFWTKISKN